MSFRFTQKIFLPFLLLFAVQTLRAQDFKFGHLGVEQGLSQSVVNCMLQDQKGFMWFGTQEGLNLYDGYNFKVFKRSPEDPNSLSNNFIYSLCQDHNGIIWIGTNGGGMDAFNPANEKFTHYTNDPKNPNSLGNDIVRTIFESKDGNLWIGTDGGLNEFDPVKNTFTRFTSNPNDPYSLNFDQVYGITEDAQGNIWIGTYGKGICMFDRTSRRFLDYRLSDADIDRLNPATIAMDNKRRTQCLQVRDIMAFDNDHLWIATNGGGIFVFNTRNHVYEKEMVPDETPATISSFKILSLADDGEGNVWIGSFDSGIDVFNKATGNIQHYTPSEHDIYGLNSPGIKCLYCDRNGDMWVGTSGEGINVYFTSTSIIGHLRRSERPGIDSNTLMSSQILSVMQDHTGLLWIGTGQGGLTTYDHRTGKYTHHPELSTASNNSILSLHEAKDGTIWVGTYGEGINHYDPVTKSIKSYTPKKELGEGTILCIAEEAGTGAIWFGTFGAGIYRLDPKTDSLRQYTAESDSLSSDYIYSLYFDQNGNLWIGTRAGGVMMRNSKTGRFTSYEHSDKDKQSLSNNIVYCITEDLSGNIWMSTANGLNRFDPATKKFTIWYEHDGLPSDNIYAVVPDDKGSLWLSHNKGITQFTMKPDGKPELHNYGQAAGVQSSEFNQGAYFGNKKGELFFGGQGGLNIIDTKRIGTKATPPNVSIVSYKRFGKEVRLDSNIILKKRIDVTWRDNNFLFELAALNFVDPTKNLYQYKLDGLDEDWSPVTNNRYVSYTNLPGGNYALHVRASDSNGNWSEDKILVRIHIEPPFWKTNWFYTLCVLLLIAGIFGFIRYRTGAIKKENRILEAKVTERTQELAQKNADITASIQYARRIQSAILPELSTVYEKLPQSFVVYKPKDIVSGDFYWFAEKNGRCIMAVADCTGHGVPGALMSMIGHNLLNQIVLEKVITDPDQVLNRLNEGVRAALKQDHHDQDTADGMDIAVCSIDLARKEVLFAGALRPLIVVRKGLLSKIDSDRFPIGGSQDTRDRKFTLHRFMLDPGDTLYMFSDGFADQFGGQRGKKFMMKQLLEIIVSINALPMNEQAVKLDKIFEDWKEGFQQVDDVLVVGIRLS